MAAIVTGEILFKFSVTTGAAGNSVAQADKNASLGKYISTTAWAGGSNDLFDDISGAENQALTDDFRCIFVQNTNAANALQNAVVYISAETAGGAVISLAVDSTAVTAINSAPVQALTIANENTPPAALTFFTTPVSPATGLALGNIGPSQCKAFWVKRHAAASSALSNDGVTISVAGDTGNL